MGGRHRTRQRRRRWPWWTGGTIAAIVVLVAADYLVLNGRLEEFAIAPPAATARAAEVRTWLIVGSDSRTALADGTDSAGFGDPQQVPGERADIILVIRQDAAGTTAFSVPRDLALQVDPGHRTRAALAVEHGYQGLVDGLCNTLGIPVTDMVVIDFATFAAAIDAVGGVEVRVDEPIRDPAAGLLIGTSGPQQLDGVQALALVRSRHAQVQRSGRWVAESDGAVARADRASAVFRAFAESARSAVGNPFTAQGLAWTLTGGLKVSDSVGLGDLFGLRSVSGDPVLLPTEPPAQSRMLTRTLSQPGREALQGWGYGGECRSGSMQGYRIDADGRVQRTSGGQQSGG